MRIIELRADNFARLKAVDIRPGNGPLVEITGANGEGKTSTLGAIWAALKGRAAAPPVPIRQGAEEAKIRLDIGRDEVELSVIRRFRLDKHGDLTTGLEVITAGARILKSPQAVIDAALGAISIDPLAFARMDAKAQFDTIRALVPGIDFDALAEERKRLFDERTLVNRQGKEAEANEARIMLPPGPEPPAVDIAAMLAKLTAAAEANKKTAVERQRRSLIQKDIDSRTNEAERLRMRAAELERQAETEQAKLEALSPLPAPEDTEALTAEIQAAQAGEGLRDKHKRRRQFHEEAERHRAESARLTRAIEDLDDRKAEAIERAKLPVDGMAIGDGVVLLGGVPLAQAAMSEKIRASTQLAMALNPDADKLRVLTIDEGSELDSRSLAMVAEMAQRAGYQVWMARVDESGRVGFVIQDGEIMEMEKSDGR